MPKILYQCLVCSLWGKSQRKSDSIKSDGQVMLVTSFVWVFNFVNYLWFQFFEISKSKNHQFWLSGKIRTTKPLISSICFKNSWINGSHERTGQELWVLGRFFCYFLFFENAGNISKPISLSAENNSYEIKEPPYNWKEFGAISNSTQHWC